MLRLCVRRIQFPCPHTRVSRLPIRSLASSTMPPTPWTPKSYPPARRSDHVDSYKSATKGDVRVADPYQWLEADTEETDKWTSAQEAFTRTHLDKNPDRQRLEDAFRASMDYAKFSSPTLYDDGRWYWFYNSGLQPQPLIYRSKGKGLPDLSQGDNVVGEVFFDPNLLSSDGTAALAIYEFSECGKYFAYGISQSGSDFSTIYVRSTDSPLAQETGKKAGPEDGRLPDEIQFVKFSSITWSKDSKGFFYQRYPNRGEIKEGIATQGDVDAMVYYHRVGTPQSEDLLIMSDKENPTWMWSVDITEDGRYIILYTMKDSSKKNLLWIADLEKNEIGPNIKWNKIQDAFDAEFHIISNDGPLLYIKTNLDAPQHKIITMDLTEDKPQPKDFILEDKEANLVEIRRVNKDQFGIIYKRNVKDEIYIYSKSGSRIRQLAPDFVGAASMSSREKQSHFFVTLTSFNTPATVARYDFTAPEEQRWSIYRSTKVKGLVPEDFDARQVWYESKDGTKVPMFIVRHKSTEFDGTAPAIQYGYGGFSISIDPFFSPTILTFLQTYGAILAVPNIRGGAEFGEEWHRAGTRERKGNVFDDFTAATEYLVKHKYAGAGKVAINGGSNGGLLIGACINRAPEGTFGAAVAEVGVLDLLKFHRFTIGKAWTSDYGDPDDPKDFDFIYPLSPLHNIPTDRTLPPTLLLTADHDDRVVPMHSFKHAATLQYTLAHNPHPLLLRVDKKAGHGAGKSTEKRIKEAADKWGFVAQSLGLVWKDVCKQASF
ncbi:prolyl oligopeptidase [Collybia nuda]|uniref:Prolyl endopeptidase n=1 Tax=Collybia nuda TaxID=64659 RepID=A0A9P5XUU2_9AGAR|nr:prolyl oligopeptidase [Collybia nuda]